MTETASAALLRARLVALVGDPLVSAFDKEALRNILADEALDFMPAARVRQVEKLLKEDEFRKRHPTATWSN